MPHVTGQGEDITAVPSRQGPQTLRLSQAMYVFHNSLVRNLKADENSLCLHYTNRLFSLIHPISSASSMHSTASEQLPTCTLALTNSIKCFSPGYFDRTVNRRALSYSQRELIEWGK